MQKDATLLAKKPQQHVVTCCVRLHGPLWWPHIFESPATHNAASQTLLHIRSIHQHCVTFLVFHWNACEMVELITSKIINLKRFKNQEQIIAYSYCIRNSQLFYITCGYLQNLTVSLKRLNAMNNSTFLQTAAYKKNRTGIKEHLHFKHCDHNYANLFNMDLYPCVHFHLRWTHGFSLNHKSICTTLFSPFLKTENILVTNS